MAIILAFGIHFLLMTVYTYMVFTNRSRLSVRHLLMALCVPFAGELCLLAAEIGTVPVKTPYRSALSKRETARARETAWQCPEDWEALLAGDEREARMFLIQALDNGTEHLPEILKKGLCSKSSEVCHIAASGLMKLHRRYEDAIAASEREYESMPGNMKLLATYIDAVDNYRVSGLPDGSVYGALSDLERNLLTRYLEMMPNDPSYTQRMALLSRTEEMPHE